MRIIIISAAGKQSSVDCNVKLAAADFDLPEEAFRRKEQALAAFKRPASQAYANSQVKLIQDGITKLQALKSDAAVELHLFSLGYGLIPEDHAVAPYDIRPSSLNKGQIARLRERLQVKARVAELLGQPYDLALLLLSEQTLTWCELTDELLLGGPTVALVAEESCASLPSAPQLRVVPISRSVATAYKCSLAALKGEMARRLLIQIGIDHTLPGHLLSPGPDLRDRLKDVAQVPTKKVYPWRKNPVAERIITLPDDWLKRQRESKFKYFLPDCDDRVDPAYDFNTDEQPYGPSTWDNAVYAHQLFNAPNFDGLLVSKAIVETRDAAFKGDKIVELGIHSFLRVPREVPVMADCGAFSYVDAPEPPYQTGEILAYYTRLGFDSAVSIDHLILPDMDAREKQFRYDLTLANARDFLCEHKKQGLPWEPIAAIQGWDPRSYTEAVRQALMMGYQHVALGGMVYRKTTDILAILEEVQTVIRPGLKMHLFGIARLDNVPKFMKYGVTSSDSTSYLVKAWTGSHNYLGVNGQFYAALRVPQVTENPTARKLIESGQMTAARLLASERECLEAIRQIDQGTGDPAATARMLIAYNQLLEISHPKEKDYIRTLADRPWQQCNCAICRDISYQVAIWRSNNHNRRRGFHNIYRFYQALASGEKPNPELAPNQQAFELTF